MEHIDSVVSKRFEVRFGKICKFCQALDAHFAERQAFDQMVGATSRYSASAHLTENGYVRHRMLELEQLVIGRRLTAA
jgi:hypothetical protein